MSDNEQKNENREKVADIVAEMRNLGKLDEKSTDKIPRSLMCLGLRTYADRIEAAWKRERAKVEADALEVGGIVEAARTAEKSSALGNAAAMREALVKAKKAICHHAEYVCQSLSWENSDIQSNCADILCAHRDLCEAKTAINAALAEPARNCDVGTAEEQAERMRLYCNSHGEDESGCFRCEKCPFLTDERCELAWAQTPYEAQEGGAS